MIDGGVFTSCAVEKSIEERTYVGEREREREMKLCAAGEEVVLCCAPVQMAFPLPLIS